MKDYFKTAVLSLGITLTIFAGLTSTGYAAACSLSPGSGALAIPTWYKYLPGDNSSGSCEIKEGLGGMLVVLILMGIFDILLYVAGFLAVILFAYGAFRLLISNGDSNKISAARTTMLNALIGVAIAIIGSQVVGFIARNLA